MDATNVLERIEPAQTLIVEQGEQIEQTTEVAGYGPAMVTVQGKTASDKRLSVINAGIASATAHYLIDKKGKVGQAVRQSLGVQGAVLIAQHAFRGNFRPLAEALAVEQGKSYTIRNREDYNAIAWQLGHDLLNLKNEGYSTSGKPTAARTALQNCIGLMDVCRTVGAAMKREADGRKLLAAE